MRLAGYKLSHPIELAIALELGERGLSICVHKGSGP
ncbi:hypothetical protein LMG29542_06836 [Paraburkholderia humisilvae]|uniref:Uncharacterized protein n=1 Tax=Paraburkholderia humisilvae TaxID=627669 RepID=A0A6J5F1M9_9BURK|nr:hypothetical protein LMG29542_06836 [Paraburkholderia humisilvae]